MPGRPAMLLLATALLDVSGIATIHARNTRQLSVQSERPKEEDRAKLLARGKELFVDRCAKCHNERGDKPLKTGAPLNERGLSTDAIARAVNGRLKDRTEDERRAVTLYISSLTKPKDSDNPAPKP